MRCKRFHDNDWIAEAEAKGVLTETEARALAELRDLVARVIAVDDFAAEELARGEALDGTLGRGVLSPIPRATRTYCR